jgi:Na+-driven multidrug efflux pump
MLATGGSAIVAHRMGSALNYEACESFSLVTAATVALGFVIALTGLLYLEPLLCALGASSVLIPYCRDYLGTLLVFPPASMLQVLFACLFVTAGRPGLGMAAGVAGGVVNAVLDYLFIISFGMGISGAALATGIGYMVPAVTGLVFFSFKGKGVLYFRAFRIDMAVLIESAWNGSSEMVGQMSTAITTFLFNVAMMSLAGENGVAAITIIIYSQFLLATYFIGFSVGVAPVISFNHGARNRGCLAEVIGISLRLILGASVAICAVVFLCGGLIASLFSPESSPVYTITRGGFRIFPIAFLFTGLNIFASAMFTALSNGALSAALSFSRNALIALGIVLLPGFFGVNGLWLAVPFAEFVSLCLAAYCFIANRERYGYA